MKLFPFLLRLYSGALLPLLGSAAAPAAEAQEFHVRSGLPNVAGKIARGEEVRVAFLGGSITAAAGWRVFTLDHLRRAYPKVIFTEIHAAVPGTGSNYGAMRLQRDVLRHRPDLLFVEFAVNDGTGSPRVEAQMEGIVRHTWSTHPATDICFVYTVMETQLKDLLAGGVQSTAASMEKVAAHYGLPSFNFGIEIARGVTAGSLIFTAPASEPADSAGKDTRGRLIFTRDKTHPTDAGHRVYTARLAAALPEFLRTGQPGPRTLPAPVRADHWTSARLVTVPELNHDDLWLVVPPNDPHMTTQTGENLVPPLWVAFEPGAKIEFHFNGTVLGLIGLKGPENGQFRVTVDDRDSETGTLFDSFSSPGRFVLKPWFFSKTLAPGEHRVRLEILATKIDKAAIMAKAGTPITDPKPFAAHGLYFGGFLIVGEPIGTKPPALERTGKFTALDLPGGPTPPTGYTLAWADEIDGTALDTARWLYRTDTRHWSTQLLAPPFAKLAGAETPSLFDRKNITAWCVVPYDAKKRGPEERAQMLQELGLTKLAYDWRAEHVPTFDAEIEAMQKHGIEITAWWYPGSTPEILDAIKRHGIHPQLWVGGSRGLTATNDAERLEAEAARIRPIAEKAAALGCKVGLYNHRDPWFEEQDHQIAIIERLLRDGLTNVGIVFNFHHWRGSLAEFPPLFKRIQPYLLAVNLNGMRADTAQYPGVRFVGTDESELAMMRVVEASGWRGPVGIINERSNLDAAEGLARNLSGIEWIQRELLRPGSGGPKPQEPAPASKVLPKPAAPAGASDLKTSK